MEYYKCTECGQLIQEKKNKCPKCGEQLFFCRYKYDDGKCCDKQLIGKNHKYCAAHMVKKKAIHKMVITTSLVILLTIISIPIIIITRGKFNPAKVLKN